MVNLSANSLRAGREYPGTWNQFLDWFHDDQSCLQYLERLRWPQGFVCPRCQTADEPYRLSRGRIMCKQCRHQSSVTAGTLFEKTRTPLTSWFAAIWYITNTKNGISALGLQKLLGLGSYQTAWSMLHRLRRAMVNPAREKLSGLIEVDETYIGGKDTDGIRTSNPKSKKAVVVIAVELLQPKGFGRIRLQQVPSASQKCIVLFVKESIKLGSEIRTDGSQVYNTPPVSG